MKKLKLNVDELQVESFRSIATAIPVGTVQGNADTMFDCHPTTDRYDRNCASEILSCLPTCNPICQSFEPFCVD